MKPDTAGLTQRLTAAKKTVKETEARLRAARTAKERDELTGVLDRATRALRSAERDVAIERAGSTFRKMLGLSTVELDVEGVE